jgi:hypothetical protein
MKAMPSLGARSLPVHAVEIHLEQGFVWLPGSASALDPPDYLSSRVTLSGPMHVDPIRYLWVGIALGQSKEAVCRTSTAYYPGRKSSGGCHVERGRWPGMLQQYVAWFASNFL